MGVSMHDDHAQNNVHVDTGNSDKDTPDDGIDSGPIVPDYQDGCLTTLMPALLFGHGYGTPLPDEVVHAKQIVLLVIDGLGEFQLRSRWAIAPRLAAMGGSRLTSVVPSTTAAALTSITTGAAPGEHGVVGYRIDVDGEILNALRWTTGRGDARATIPPDVFQASDPFLGQPATVVTGSQFSRSGFTQAHLAGARFRGYHTTASLTVEIDQALQDNDRFVFAYYHGLDIVGHEFGHGKHYDAEVAFVDRLVGEVVDRLPSGAALVVTADHGQVESLPPQPLDRAVTADVVYQSGEARLRWLHCRRGSAAACRDAAVAHHGDQAWIASLEEVFDARWLGANITADARTRLGDVAIAARGRYAFLDPNEGGRDLVGRHGSLTAAEMIVPLRWAVA